MVTWPLQQLGAGGCEPPEPPIPHHLTEGSNSRGVYLFTISNIKLDEVVARRCCSVKYPLVVFCSLVQQKASNRTADLVLVCIKKLTAR